MTRSQTGRWSRYAVLVDVPELRVLWTARLVSKLGDWSARLALITLVYQATDSALWAGLTTAACYAPWLGPGQLIATVADRLPHRSVMIAADLLRLPVFVLLALVPMHPALMVTLAFVASFGDVPFSAAYQASLPLVAKRRYSDALVLFNTTNQVAMLVGYAGGGVLVVLLGAHGVLLLNAGTFLVAATLLRRLPVTRSGTGTLRARAHLAESVRIVGRDRLVAVALLLVAASCIGQMALESLTVVYADHLGWGTGIGAGLIYTVMPVAGIVAGFWIPSSGDPLRLVRVIVGLNIGLGAASAALFVAFGGTPLGLVGFALQGVLDMLVIPLFFVAESRIAESHRATVFSFFQGCFMAMQLVGALTAGLLTELVGIQGAFSLACAPAAVAGVATLRLLGREPATAVPVAGRPLAA